MRKALLALITFRGACSSTNAVTPSTGGAPFPAPTSADISTADAAAPVGLQRLNHIVVILLENWSFDSLYAEFKGAEGSASALEAPSQIDPTSGQPYATLPQTESHMPSGLLNKPFALDPYLTVADDTSIDLTTNFYTEQQQIDDGKMDLFLLPVRCRATRKSESTCSRAASGRGATVGAARSCGDIASTR